MRIYNQKDIRTMENKVYIGRPSIWGNPYIIGKHGSREDVIAKYEKYLENCPLVTARLKELVGRDLVCHCKPKSCHGDVLAKLVELDIQGKIERSRPHRLAIVGSRSFRNYDLFKKYLELTIERLSINFDIIISGGALGVDSMAARYANDNNINYIEYPAEWNKYGNKAGYLRNTTIVENSTYILAFWDHNSNGTYDTIDKARYFNKEVHIINTRKLK